MPDGTRDSRAAYEEMTAEEKKQYDALVKRLDEMIAKKRQEDRRQKTEPIDFTDRRVAERRRS